MKKTKILQTMGAGAMALTLMAVSVPVRSAMAWGPKRQTYTNNSPATSATFNSIIDNAAVGDEREFVRIAEKKQGSVFSGDLTLEAGKKYEVYIYYHNDASKTFNDKAHNYVGVARDVRVSTNFPDELKAGQTSEVTGKISASNTTPLAVWDEATIHAKEAMTLHYVTGSAKIYNSWGVNGSVLSTQIFSKEGTLIGLNQLNGVILGCDEYSGQIVYTIETKPVEPEPQPEPEPEPEPDPEPEPEPDPEPEPEPKPDPEIPETLPETGPFEIILAVVIGIAIAAGMLYFVRTHNAVGKATKKAKGKGKKK